MAARTKDIKGRKQILRKPRPGPSVELEAARLFVSDIKRLPKMQKFARKMGMPGQPALSAAERQIMKAQRKSAKLRQTMIDRKSFPYYNVRLKAENPGTRAQIFKDWQKLGKKTRIGAKLAPAALATAASEWATTAEAIEALPPFAKWGARFTIGAVGGMYVGHQSLREWVKYRHAKMSPEQRAKVLWQTRQQIVEDMRKRGGMGGKEMRRRAEEMINHMYMGALSPETFDLKRSKEINVDAGRGKIVKRRGIDITQAEDQKLIGRGEARLISNEYAFTLYEGSIGLREELLNEMRHRGMAEARALESIKQRQERIREAMREIRRERKKVPKETIRRLQMANEEALVAMIDAYSKLNPKHTRRAIAYAKNILIEGEKALKDRKFVRRVSPVEKKRIEMLMGVSMKIVEGAKRRGIEPTAEETRRLCPGITSLRKASITRDILREEGASGFLDMLQFNAGAMDSEYAREMRENLAPRVEREITEVVSGSINAGKRNSAKSRE